MPQRYFLTDQETLSKQDEHHIRHVMRMKTNDQVIVCYQGICHEATLDISKDMVTYTKGKQLDKQESLKITMIQGLPKGSKTDFIAKSASLFGASHLIFVPMQRSIAKLENTPHKLKRLESISKEASELANRQENMQISFQASLRSIDFSTFDSVFLADENEKTLRLNQAVKSFGKGHNMCFIIGPEGGISEEERQWLQQQNIQSISLGNLIFPTEYAHLYILSYLSAHYLQ
jgi:16S rRNA (uracil1498-N3)-methyltransferase